MSLNTPAVWKDNPVTRRADQVKQLNQSLGTRSSGRGLPAPLMSTTGLPDPNILLAKETGQTYIPVGEVDVRNAPLTADGKPLPIISPLSLEDQQALEREWLAQNPGRKMQGVTGGGDELDDILDGTVGMTEKQAAAAAPLYIRSPGMRVNPMSLPNRTVSIVSDLSKIESIDLLHKVVVVDGSPFRYDDKYHVALMTLVVKVLRKSLMGQLSKALKPEVKDARIVKTKKTKKTIQQKPQGISDIQKVS